MLCASGKNQRFWDYIGSFIGNIARKTSGDKLFIDLQPWNTLVK
jgi:hypothetical protein